MRCCWDVVLALIGAPETESRLPRGGARSPIAQESEHRFARPLPTGRAVFNASGGADRLRLGLCRSGHELGERALRLALAGEDADHVARAGAHRQDDHLAGREAHELIIRGFHDLPPCGNESTTPT